MQENCPTCGHDVTLESLTQEIKDMRDEGRRRSQARIRAAREADARARQGDFAAGDGTATLSFIDPADVRGISLELGVGVSIAASHDHAAPEIQADVEISNRKTCAKCGTWWRPDAAQQAEILKEELLRVTNEVYTPIERMAKLSEDDV